MRIKLLILLLFVALCSVRSVGQTVVLPDTIFDASQAGYADGREMPQSDYPSFTFDYIGESFRVAPGASWDELADMPWADKSQFSDLPEVASQFFLHVLLLHLSKIKIAGLDEHMAQYNLMLGNFNRNLYDNLQGPAVLYSGCLDPVEAYRRWVQERRLKRAKSIIQYLEDDTPVMSPKKVPESSFKLPDNLLQEDNFDVKVKSAGDNPPYRPW